ncbi:mgpp2cl-1, protein phosphatase 2C-like protein 1 [Friedmanniomyces endolithicus]|uniref:Mgpp2cl-1, protein phosphatase 2C-like protein 1 n=1 Tax=Friedmanniomyces endolithicus TaxID=329885 RepID=A0AAN6H521_9PEZI|nr:mgpp2cl-1, protein phosphatase 2C-like protein 1 [Friedmanniomyces endolithicus]KAK0289961.1 mgpp2cl-1, protein phosphatase 2C-like protein 1 [Friedmanniomyces endolithicus]KAK0326066.1 mgpp2cl-1, protein phosphatase 2C-like protein 1 [Friedmanniomyces endolithicus]KAK0925496.1 mgpp2cl-1, protein phosphatase 2C-like protein 1 [Friedmanniomyces endolithicus]KAK0947106.1 mgpp2cl-1, protein phosphatase 2C-like protein 1 [Friedmanniomyces endolithicus]
MFGSSGGNGRESNSNAVAVDGGQTDGLPASPITATPLSASNPIGPVEENKDETSSDVRSPTKGSESAQSLEKKRRSSGVGRARDLFSSAKQSLRDMGTSSPEHRNPGGSPQTPMQKLGKLDPALGVPQGAHNNSAGESAPGPRSTFRVGVTEDKNKKCRRTMEDTHAFLYNFLSTPAPVLTSGASSKARSSLETGVAMSETSSQGVVETDNGYFAIFDGHAGSFAADWCGKKVHLLLEDVIRKHPNSPIPELLDMTFTSVDQQLEKLPLKNSGCTAALAVLRWEDRIPNSQSATGSTAIAPAAAAAVKSDGGYTHTAPEFSDVGATEVKLRQAATRQRVLYTANVGDARIVLCRNGKALRLSYDHKGSDENEGKRIAGAGGLILNNRVNGVLAVTRALGDAYMKDLVTGHPYTTETVIQPDIDEFMILACDGANLQLWDVCSDQEAVDLIRITQDPQYASRQLVEHALARFSTDNLSCMVVRFDSKAVQQTVAHEVEPIGVDGDPATKHGGVSEAEAIVMEQKAKLDQTGEKMDRIPSDAELMGEHREMGPELNAEALDRARKDKDVLGHGPNQ